MSPPAGTCTCQGFRVRQTTSPSVWTHFPLLHPCMLCMPHMMPARLPPAAHLPYCSRGSTFGCPWVLWRPAPLPGSDTQCTRCPACPGSSASLPQSPAGQASQLPAPTSQPLPLPLLQALLLPQPLPLVRQRRAPLRQPLAQLRPLLRHATAVAPPAATEVGRWVRAPWPKHKL